MACSRDVLIPIDTMSGLASDLEVAAYRLEEGDGPQGPIDARALLRRAADACQSSERLLIVTERDLRMRSLQSLFGFANRRRRVAVVSTARLGNSGNPLLATRRLRNVAAHELGHLKGLHHCDGPQCVMKAVTTPEEIDRRPLKPCGDSESTRSSIVYIRPAEWTAVNGIFALLGFVITMYYFVQTNAFTDGRLSWGVALFLRIVVSLAVANLTGGFCYLIIVLGAFVLFYWAGIHLGYFQS
jgi:predicted Zn-dependent protease